MGTDGNERSIVNQTFNDIEFAKTLHSIDVSGYLDLPTQIAERYGSYSDDLLSLDRKTAELVRLWVARKYGCEYCSIFHSQDARDAGIDIHKIDALSSYAQSALFTDAEKAALTYAAAISDVNRDQLRPATAEVKRHFTDEAVETIIMCTVLMETWVRIFAAQGNQARYAGDVPGRVR